MLYHLRHRQRELVCLSSSFVLLRSVLVLPGVCQWRHRIASQWSLPSFAQLIGSPLRVLSVGLLLDEPAPILGAVWVWCLESTTAKEARSRDNSQEKATLAA